MESRNVVVCDNGTGVSPPRSLSPPSLRSIPFLDPPPDLFLGRISGRASRVAPWGNRRCFVRRLGGRFASRWTRAGSCEIEEFWDQYSVPPRGEGLADFKVDDSIL